MLYANYFADLLYYLLNLIWFADLMLFVAIGHRLVRHLLVRPTISLLAFVYLFDLIYLIWFDLSRSSDWSSTCLSRVRSGSGFAFFFLLCCTGHPSVVNSSSTIIHHPSVINVRFRLSSFFDFDLIFVLYSTIDCDLFEYYFANWLICCWYATSCSWFWIISCKFCWCKY